MKTLAPSTPAGRSSKSLWGWVLLAAVAQMGMASQGCLGGRDEVDGIGNGGSSGGGDSFGDGGSASNPRGGCNVDGKHYALGEWYPVSDSCNSCQCSDDDRSAMCTTSACATGGSGGAGGYGGDGGYGGTAGSAGTGGYAGTAGFSGSAGSGGSGGSGGTECNNGNGCVQPPCACLDSDGDNQCDNHCPTYACVGGQCVDVAPQPMTCGGLLGTDCAPGEFCKFLPEARCGAADATGECTLQPELCTQQYDPVCGCDGKTYGNACTAQSGGVSVAARGACAGSATLGVGDSCGGLMPPDSPQCGEGLFCQYQPGALCGAADASGECVAIPSSCPTTRESVCGCNGVNYLNACNAALAQAGILHTGRCP